MIGLDGSTATTATVRPAARSSPIRAATSVDLPAPGGPVMPDEMGVPGPRVELAQGRLGDRRPVLDRGQQPGQRAAVAGEGRVVAQLGGPLVGRRRPR